MMHINCCAFPEDGGSPILRNLGNVICRDGVTARKTRTSCSTAVISSDLSPSYRRTVQTVVSAWGERGRGSATAVTLSCG